MTVRLRTATGLHSPTSAQPLFGLRFCCVGRLRGGQRALYMSQARIEFPADAITAADTAVALLVNVGSSAPLLATYRWTFRNAK